MGSEITLEQVCERLKEQDNILILAHQNPDGDTLGSCFALLFALQAMGKRARVECSDPFPPRYRFMFPNYVPEQFTEQFIVAADIADTQLFGKNSEKYTDRVDLCIDHHPSNTFYAKETYLVADAAATAEVVADVIDRLGVPLDLAMATCIYTGLSTDTGCFRFSNTTAKTHLIASRVIDLGVDNAEINREMFGRKTQSRIAIEREVYNTMEYHFGNKCAVICMTREMLEKAGADDSELEGVSTIPCQIEGVEVGVTLREKEDGFKVSLRTGKYIDASEICARLGGGGHARASGCFIADTLENAKKKVLDVVEQAFADAPANRLDTGIC
ncbi:bifunctional oligoribonuclease/PAP phosphatase NrnA [Hydrogenoanaerobacterium sp.]|uniref:DHH family phosphoesterase n=1 Tax=Hydrogenoanaerobacterium sp. TaxID=2953763 RepID=UPI00289F68C7|nr:bifunctional oligoribonuclease/PAP phosphatase NrnA [Hydrogenoanaerobacterium sp.]